MNLIPRFIWKIFNPNIEISSGRGICSTCKKYLNEICQVSNDKKFYCRKHAKQRFEEFSKNKSKYAKENIYEDAGKYYEPTKESEAEIKTKNNKSPSKKKNSKWSGYCEQCDEKIGGLDAYECSYCHYYFCREHRLPEDHNCSNKNLRSLKKEGNAIYK